MQKIHFDGRTFECIGGASVLDTLLMGGVDLPYSCKTGACKACLMRMEKGKPSPASQKDLTAQERKAGYFLPCSHKPSDHLKEEDITVSMIDGTRAPIRATIAHKEFFTPSILRLLLKVPPTFHWEGGQFVNLLLPHKIIRSYSIANLPGPHHLMELHVRLRDRGRATPWLFYEANRGDSLDFLGPYGTCFYVKDDNTRSDHIVLLGFGTGIAPLYGVLQSALRDEHQGSLTILHCTHDEEDAYLTVPLSAMDHGHDNVTYQACFRHKQVKGYLHGDILAHLPKIIISPQRTKFFVCGNPKMVMKAKNDAFLCGLPSSHIFGEIFHPPG